jgi:5''-methylthioadenosine/S-adenosylhomocysteine nucleosidase
MSKIAVIGAMQSEVKRFCDLFGATETQIKGILRGEYATHEIFVCECGIGKVNAAITTQKLIDLFQVEAIINSGVAGAISRELSTCDIVISDRLTYHDFNPIDILEHNAPFLSVFKADEKMVSAAEKACEKVKEHTDFNYRTGMIVSGDCFVSDSAYAEHLRVDFKALCTEMEGAAIAHTAIMSGIPFVVIRAVSDFADENGELSFDEFSELAADRASLIVSELLQHI